MSRYGRITLVTVSYECECCGGEWEEEFSRLNRVPERATCEDCEPDGYCDSCNPECDDCGERNCGSCTEEEEEEGAPVPVIAAARAIGLLAPEPDPASVVAEFTARYLTSA